jgi:tRNA (guanine37-N1)-methyltransferase
MHLIDDGLELSRNERGLLIPLLRQPSNHDLSVLKEKCGELVVIEAEFKEFEILPKNLQEAVRGQLPSDLLTDLPRSFDVIGDIAVIELPDRLNSFSSVIGKGILRLNPRLRLVLKKSGDVSGEFRTRTFERIEGQGGTETLYHEFGCDYRLDVATVYFNPRLSHERKRVAEQVTNGEHVVDMFAGVGPYSILIAKTRSHSTVHSIDINPEAIKYLGENALLNKVADRVIPIQGDARLLAMGNLRGIADRVIMNLPSDSINFIDAANQLLKKEGGAVNYYAFTSRNEDLGKVKDEFRIAVERAGRRVQSFTYERAIREVAPNRVQIALDVIVK